MNTGTRRPDVNALLSREVWTYFAGYYRKQWHTLLLYMIITAAQSLVFLPSLWLVRKAFDTAIPRSDMPLLIWIGVGLFALRLANSAVALAMRALIVRLIKSAAFEMRRDLLATLYGLSHQFFAQTEADRLHARIVQETERVDGMANALLSAMLPAVFAGLCLGGGLLWLNWRLTLLAGCAVPFVFVAARITGRMVKGRVGEFQRAFEGFSHGIRFVLRQMDLTHAQGFETQEQERQKRGLEHLRRTGERMAMSYALHGQVHQNVTGLAGIVLLVFGGVAILHKTMSIGDFLVFYLAAGLLNGFVERISNAIPNVISGHVALMTLLGIRHAGPALPYSGMRRINFRGNLRMHTVSYAIAGREVLRDITLDIRPGACIAIVGPNGIGKSTIINLIIGFCAPDAGEIRAEDVDYGELDMPALRRSIGVVMQHPTFFSGTIAENIAYGTPDADETMIMRAARQACASTFIEALPEGYRSRIGDEGARFSGGELQRIAIARALIRSPALLVLDEPTNHLDAASVDGLMHALVSDPSRPALLIVSHDPSVVRYADTVYRIEEGVLMAETTYIAAAPQQALMVGDDG